MAMLDATPAVAGSVLEPASDSTTGNAVRLAETRMASPAVVPSREPEQASAEQEPPWNLPLPAPLLELLELIDESIDRAASNGAESGATFAARPTDDTAIDSAGSGTPAAQAMAPADVDDDLAQPSVDFDQEAARTDADSDSASDWESVVDEDAEDSLPGTELDPEADPGLGPSGTNHGLPGDPVETEDPVTTELAEDPAAADPGSDPAGVGDVAASANDTGTGTSADDASAWGPPLPDADTNEYGAVPISLLAGEIEPGRRERLHWTTGQSFSGSVMETPVVVVHGLKRGPRLCLTAGIHGDELNGIEIVRRLAYRIEPEQLAGTVVAVPIVNLLGFSRGSRYLPDRRDLNRFFPGSPYGSSASRIAHSFFTAVIEHCDALVDIHTGSLDRANLPQVRGDLTNPQVLEFTRGFGATAVLHSPGTPGMLRFAASTRGIPAVTFEIGAPMRLQPEEIGHGVEAIETLLNKMGMIEKRRRWREPQAVFYESRWVRVDHGGMLFSDVALGDRVRAGQRLGRVIDPVSNRSAQVHAPEAGRIIGMALNQLVLPGFAAYNLGIAASEEQVVIDAVQDADPDDERYLEIDQLDQDRRTRDDGEDDEPGHGRERELELEQEYED